MTAIRWLVRAAFAVAWHRLLVMVLVVAGALALAFLSLGLISYGVDGARAQLGGVAGEVVVDECRWSASGWRCSGEFRADDGSLRIADIALDAELPQQPREPVRARVSGESAMEAVTGRSQFHWVSIGLGVVCGALAVAAGYALVWLVRLWPPVREPHGNRPAAAPGPPAPAPPAGRLPVNPFLMLVLVWYVLLALTTAALVQTVASLRDQEGSESTAGEVIGGPVGAAGQVVVRWRDQTGQAWETFLTPRESGQFADGDLIELRFDPERPDLAHPVDDRFEEAPDDIIVWVVLVLILTGLLLWAWTWRLGRWVLGTLRPARAMRAEALVAIPPGGSMGIPSPPSVFWLRVSDGREAWFQRAMWHRRLVDFALAGTASGPDGPPNAAVRHCPGWPRMYVVDLPGYGRIWPASRAREGRPLTHDLRAFQPWRLGERRAEWEGFAGGAVFVTVGILFVMVLMGCLGWMIAGPVAAAAMPVLLISYVMWVGGGSWRGIYAYRPAPESTSEREPSEPAA